MQSFWTSHLKTEEEKEAFRDYVSMTSSVTDRIKEFLIMKIEAQETVSIPDYDCPSWAYKEADRNGYLRALTELETFLTFDPKEM